MPPGFKVGQIGQLVDCCAKRVQQAGQEEHKKNLDRLRRYDQSQAVGAFSAVPQWALTGARRSMHRNSEDGRTDSAVLPDRKDTSWIGEVWVNCQSRSIRSHKGSINI
jgi:hypothetical protein